MLFSLAYLAVVIIPSMPRLPKPPGTIMPSTSLNNVGAFSSVIVSEEIQFQFFVCQIRSYSDLFKSGETMTVDFSSATDEAAYLTVTATPDSSAWQQIGVPWAYGT